MGNQVEKLAHLSYAEVPTTEPGYPGPEEDGARIGVSYIFCNDHDDDDDVTADDHRDEETELECAIYHKSDCVYERRATRSGSVETLLNQCKPGDLLEFVCANQSARWAVYIGQNQVVYQDRVDIKCALVSDAARGRKCRNVSELYKYAPLCADAVVRSATERVGLRAPDVSWRNSECFAAWCKFGRREFKTGGELRIGKQPYKLHLIVAGKRVRTAQFQTLEDVMMERRRTDLLGRTALLRELADSWNGHQIITHTTHDH